MISPTNIRLLAREVLRNLVIVALVSVPVGLVGFHLIQLARGRGTWFDVLDSLVYYPAVLVACVAGVILYSLVILEYTKTRGRMPRPLAVGLTLLVVGGWFTSPVAYLLFLPPMMAGMAAGLVALGLLAETPDSVPEFEMHARELRPAERGLAGAEALIRSAAR